MIPAPNPKIAMSQDIRVAPILAPIIMRMAWESVSAPALTKLTIMTVAALEDSAIAVIPAPETMLDTGFRLMDWRNDFSLSPVSFSIPLLSRFSP